MTTWEMLRQICVVLTLFYCVNSQVFSSVRNLEIVYNEEGKLVEALRDFVKVSLTEGQHVNESITSFLQTVDEERSRVQNVVNWVSNPINALHFIIRVITDWEQVMASITCDMCKETGTVKDLLRVWTAAKDISNYWPSLEDKQEAYKSILRLWNLYDLNHEEIMNGKIGKFQADPLTSSEVLEMLKQSKRGNRQYNQVVWLQSLSDRRSNTSLKIDLGVSEEEMDFELATAYADYMYPGKVLDIMSKYEDSEERRVQLRHNILVRRAYEMPVHLQKRDVKKPKREWGNQRTQHKRLCNGDEKLATETPPLTCQYRSTRVAYYRVKEEFLHENPPVSMFYGLITETEIQDLLSRADKELRQSLTTDDQRHWTKQRVSQSAWMNDLEDRILTKINQRIKLVTGLNIAHTQEDSLLNQYEVINYGLGGMHVIHLETPAKPLEDSYTERLKEKQRIKVMADKDKMATWVFYLSSVEEGGATVFPELGVRVPVTKGSALFWFNMDSFGSVDQRLLYADCPVIIGSKWTAKKWISYDENMFSSRNERATL